MITTGPMNQCVKTGLYFSLGSDDRVFTGDMFYNFATREFQIRGIPSFGGTMSHVLPKAERGPVHLHILIQTPKEVAVRDEQGRYTDLSFTTAKIARPFVVWIEEWCSHKTVLDRILSEWEVVPNLLWYK